MKTQTAFLIRRLRFALEDWRHAPAAYEILATHGQMERTANGYKAISPESFQRRAEWLIEYLEEKDAPGQGMEANGFGYRP
jgi:hypothetical protein